VAAEETVWTGSPSQWLNAGKFLLCALGTLTGFLAVFAIPYAIWRWLVVKNMRYELSTQRLKCHSGVLNKKTEELELYRVKDSRFDEPFLMRMVGLGNVTVVSSDSTTPTTSLLALREGGPLREKIRALVEERREQKRVRIAEFE
jgi:membrane protein YdbS with pleckstrin-like domain